MDNNNVLGKYYIDLDRSLGEDFSEYEFTKNGLPKVRFNRSSDWQHNPVTISQYGLKNYNLYLQTGEDRYKNVFLTQANWLVQNSEKGPNNSGVWYYRLDIPFYKLSKPWISGMAQGESLSILLRAFQLTNNEDFLKLVNKVWNIFNVPVKDKGVIGEYGNELIIEEYPTQPSSSVLNGFILALFGVYDYWKFSNNYAAKQLFDQCVSGLKKNLDLYDTKYWSFYDLWHPKRLTSRKYHRLHILLLHELYKVTGEKVFLKKSELWKTFLKNPVSKIRWGIHKAKYRLKYD